MPSPTDTETPAVEERVAPPAGAPGKESLPPLVRDRAFYGMTITQFLGAFNDSVYKQIASLLLVKVAVGDSVGDWQGFGAAIFASSFILFSGIAGFWSDRISKRTIIVGAKVAEIVIMAAGIVGFATLAPEVTVRVAGARGTEIVSGVTPHLPWFVLGVLFCMGAQSAVFGPAKYGILPELSRPRDLPNFNGVIQLTTFLALILGPALGGYLCEKFSNNLWIAGIVCTAIAVLGTMSAPLVRRTPVAEPNAPFRWSALWVLPEIRSLLRRDRRLLGVVALTTLFWSIGQVAFLAINSLGKNVLDKNDFETSLLLAILAIGMGLGFVIAAALSRGRVAFRLVRIGTWGLQVSFALLALPGIGTKHLLGYGGSLTLLAFAGIFVGFCFLPLQVFIQSRPPDALKGRMIGTSNLLNWVGMSLSAVLYWGVVWVLERIGVSPAWVFALLAVALAPVAVYYRPREETLD
jgi:acyl-[acyl-carrier-protein]-phospholipid O-acyltransferase/long-chain-fatty-acid--[acyl-carrier-protein] ligase